MRVLFVEDSASLRQTVAAALRRSGYAVDVAGDGEEGATLATTEPYDVLVLDIMLPRLDGLGILRRVRAAGRDTPVLMLTARTAVSDRVAGLNHGADDYLGKPFALEELLARVQALGRRRYGQTVPQISVGPLMVDTVSKTANCDGRAVELTAREYALLEYLAFRRGAVVSRTDIEAHIYDDLADPMSNVVDSAICLLRKKLSDAGAPPLIHTRRGLGYCLAASEA
jgi:DNA-binding response OmpR family regulator